jgi:GT2 family glycosyltransferase
MTSTARAAPRMSIIVVNYRTARITCDCLAAVRREVAAGSYELIVVDNASGDDSVARIRAAHPDIQLITAERNGGFGAGNNLGVAAAVAPHLILLNSDAILGGDTPNRMVDFLEAHPDVACVGPRIDLPDGTRQPKVCGNRPSPWRATMQSFGLSRLSRLWHGFDGIDAEGVAERVTRVGWISGVCMAMRTADYRAVGGFDTAFFMYCEDIDLCMRLERSCGRVVHVDDWPVMHLGGASSTTVDKRVRNAIWQQRNLLTIIGREYGGAGSAAARIGMLPGLCVRLGLGIARFGRDGNYLLYSAWARLLDSLGLWRGFGR